MTDKPEDERRRPAGRGRDSRYRDSKPGPPRGAPDGGRSRGDKPGDGKFQSGKSHAAQPFAKGRKPFGGKGRDAPAGGPAGEPARHAGKPYREKAPYRDKAAYGDASHSVKRHAGKPFPAKAGAAARRDGEAGSRPWSRSADAGQGRATAGAGRPYRGKEAGAERPQRHRPRVERPEGERSAGETSIGERPMRRPRPAADRGGDAPKRFERPRGPYKPRDASPTGDRAASPSRDRAASLQDRGQDDGRERIAKVMARAGVASRRDAEAMIEAGRVTVNSGTISTPAILVGPGDRIAIDGQPMPARQKTRLWLYHKPAGLVTTAHDPEGRPTVFDNLPEGLPRVVSIGRLDINTEGLLLLTNDGGLARVLAHPETGWLRRYRVRAFGSVSPADLDALKDGISIDDMHYGPIEASIQREQGDNVWLMLGLREGKNREVKRVLEHLGLSVNRLIRLSFGPFQLGDMAEGTVDEVRTRILKDQLGPDLAAKAGVDFDAEPAAPAAAARPPRPTPLGPSGDDRPRRWTGFGQQRGQERGEQRGQRGEEAGGRRGGDRPGGKPPRAARLPAPATGTAQRSIWRDADAEGAMPRGKRVPRRGEDPKAARTASGEREHVRAGRVADPKGRRVIVERIVAAPKAEPERPARGRDDRPRRDQAEGGRAPRPRPSGERSSEPGSRPGRERPHGEGAPRARPPYSGPRPGGQRPEGRRPGGPRPGGRPGGGPDTRPSGGGRRGPKRP